MKAIFTLIGFFSIICSYSQVQTNTKKLKKTPVHRKITPRGKTAAVNGLPVAKDSLPRQTITEKRLAGSLNSATEAPSASPKKVPFVSGIHASENDKKTFDTTIRANSQLSANNRATNGTNVTGGSIQQATNVNATSENSTTTNGFSNSSVGNNSNVNSGTINSSNGNVNGNGRTIINSNTSQNNAPNNNLNTNNLSSNNTNINANATNNRNNGSMQNSTTNQSVQGTSANTVNATGSGFNNNNAVVNDTTLNINTGNTSNLNTANVSATMANGNVARGTVAVAADTIYNANTIQYRGSIPTNSGATDKSGQVQFGQSNWGDGRSTVGESQWTVPPPIVASFNSEFPGHGSAAWTRNNWTLNIPDSAIYTAKYKSGGGWITARYNAAGQRIDVRTETPYAKAPQAIRSLIDRQFEGFDITSLIRVQVEGKQDTYEIKTRSGRTISITNDKRR